MTKAYTALSQAGRESWITGIACQLITQQFPDADPSARVGDFVDEAALQRIRKEAEGIVDAQLRQQKP